MSGMLNDLLELEKFMDGSDNCVFEAELWDKYGKTQTMSAIDSGLIEHRRIKFRDGYGRCICWLSPKGREIAETHNNISNIIAN